MDYPTNIYFFNGTQVKNTWIKTYEVEKYSPIRQVYGVVFNDKNEILICRSSKEKDWQIPGGSPEKGETIEETLKRELLEEVDIEVSNIKPIGVQEATLPDSPNKKPIYQVRCIAKLTKLLPQTSDPDSGNTWERKFVPANEITKYVKWGVTGEAMFKDAIEMWNGQS